MIKTTYDYRNTLENFTKPYLRAVKKWLGYVGGYTRKVARNSLKPARRKRNLDELTDEELDWHVLQTRRNEQLGLDPPPLPERSSKPGQPPALHGQRSPLKHLLNYAVDAPNKEAVIGPERARSAIANRLEFGHGQQLPRPFMGPAEEKTRPRMAALWADAITP
jgi:hypothetical protein